MTDALATIKTTLAQEFEYYSDFIEKHPVLTVFYQAIINEESQQNALVAINNMFRKLKSFTGTEADVLAALDIQLNLQKTIAETVAQPDKDTWITFDEPETAAIHDNFLSLRAHGTTYPKGEHVLPSWPHSKSNEKKTNDASAALNKLQAHLILLKQAWRGCKKTQSDNESAIAQWDYYLNAQHQTPPPEKRFLVEMLDGAHHYINGVLKHNYSSEQKAALVTIITGYQTMELSILNAPRNPWEECIQTIKNMPSSKQTLPPITQAIIGKKTLFKKANTDHIATDEADYQTANAKLTRLQSALFALQPQPKAKKKSLFSALACELNLSTEQLTAWIHYHLLPMICLADTDDTIERLRQQTATQLAEFYQAISPECGAHHRMLLLNQALFCNDLAAIQTLHDQLRLAATHFLLQKRRNDIGTARAEREDQLFEQFYQGTPRQLHFQVTKRKQFEFILTLYQQLRQMWDAEIIAPFQERMLCLLETEGYCHPDFSLLAPALREKRPNAIAEQSMRNLKTMCQCICNDTDLENTEKKQLLAVLCDTTVQPEDKQPTLLDANFTHFTNPDLPSLNTLIDCLKDPKRQLQRNNSEDIKHRRIISHYIKPIIYTPQQRQALIKHWRQEANPGHTLETPEKLWTAGAIDSSIRKKARKYAKEQGDKSGAFKSSTLADRLTSPPHSPKHSPGHKSKTLTTAHHISSQRRLSSSPIRRPIVPSDLTKTPPKASRKEKGRLFADGSPTKYSRKGRKVPGTDPAMLRSKQFR